MEAREASSGRILIALVERGLAQSQFPCASAITSGYLHEKVLQSLGLEQVLELCTHLRPSVSRAPCAAVRRRSTFTLGVPTAIYTCTKTELAHSSKPRVRGSSSPRAGFILDLVERLRVAPTRNVGPTRWSVGSLGTAYLPCRGKAYCREAVAICCLGDQFPSECLRGTPRMVTFGFVTKNHAADLADDNTTSHIEYTGCSLKPLPALS